LNNATTKESDYNGIFLEDEESLIFSGMRSKAEEDEELLNKTNRVLQRASLVLPDSALRRRNSKEVDRKCSKEVPGRSSSKDLLGDASVDVARRYSKTRLVIEPIDVASLRREEGSKRDLSEARRGWRRSLSSQKGSLIASPRLPSPTENEPRRLTGDFGESAEPYDVFDAAREVEGADAGKSAKRRSLARRQTLQAGAAVIKNWKLPESLKLANIVNEKGVRTLPPCNGKVDDRDQRRNPFSRGSSMILDGDFDFDGAVPVAPSEERMVHRPRASVGRRLTAVQTMPEKGASSPAASDEATTGKCRIRTASSTTSRAIISSVPRGEGLVRTDAHFRFRAAAGCAASIAAPLVPLHSHEQEELSHGAACFTAPSA
jgi:hypothetical protein